MITCDCQRKKEEVRCNARSSNPEPSGRQTSLKCDDECARLERNRKLAMALHISDDHTDDHVPYSTSTLQMYLEDVAWAHAQEEALRLFAADETQKRYRCQPMRSRQRSFIHSLAEDFGFDGESLDPEPHRHVVLFKTPKFVAAPMKTLAQAARIKRAQLNVAAPVHSVPERKADEVKHEYNGLMLTKPKFALTEDELRPVVKKAAPTIDLDIVFLPNDQGVALLPSMSWETAEQLTTLLTSLQPTIAAEVSKHSLAGSVVLCQFDTTGVEVKVVQQQGKPSDTFTNGWSKVAARRAAPAPAPQVRPVGQRPVFTVLGSRLAEAKKKKEENEAAKLRKKVEAQVVDDWEKEVDEEESHEVEKSADNERAETGDPSTSMA
ncbi:FKBP12-associated protein [Rhinocladiella similis]